ncbi:MAG: hypothetical protein KDA84_15235 [Planctomycetaceae bacterium]|nr:hypothetical protein [Planctomycetaceae bacterium]
MKFQQDIHEVFAVTALPGMLWPDLINEDTELIGQSYVLSDEDLQQVPSDFLSTSPCS